MLNVTDEYLSSFCPNCGNWDESIFYEIGWCHKCVSEHLPGYNLCKKCNRAFKFYHEEDAICQYCKTEQFLEQNGDRIEEYMLRGYGLDRAIRTVRKDLRPICLCCRNPIVGAKGKAVFCKTTPSCIEARRIYDKHRSRQKRAGVINQRLLIELTLREINGNGT